MGFLMACGGVLGGSLVRKETLEGKVIENPDWTQKEACCGVCVGRADGIKLSLCVCLLNRVRSPIHPENLLRLQRPQIEGQTSANL